MGARGGWLAAAALAVLALTAGGCGGGGAAPISPKDEAMMRSAPGTTPMPPEAARAMQEATRRGQAARQGGTGTR